MEEVLTAKKALEFLESKGIHAKAMEDSTNILKGGFSFKGGSLTYFLDFDKDCKHLHIEVLEFAKIPDEKLDDMYKVVNECNSSYNFVKFIVNEKRGELIARADAVIDIETCGEECYELLIRTVQIIESAYPTIMKAVWS